MKRLFLAMTLACAAGCATIKTASDYLGCGVDGGETPLETVEIENTGWLLFKCIPIWSGNPERPNAVSTRFFRNTVTLQNHLDMLQHEMKRCGATRMTNLSSRKTDESILLIIFSHQAYHTSAVLLK